MSDLSTPSPAALAVPATDGARAWPSPPFDGYASCADTLAGLPAAAAALSGPALLIVGEAMALAVPSAHPREGGEPLDARNGVEFSLRSRVHGNERSVK